MKLQIRTHEELFDIAKAIVRGVTGVEYPFGEGTFHRALLQVPSMFGADTSVQCLRLVNGLAASGLKDTLLDRKLLENGLARNPPTSARVSGRFRVITGVAPAGGYFARLGTKVMRAATPTQSEIAFTTEAAATIAPGDAISNLVYAVCNDLGTRGNAIVDGTSLDIGLPINGILDFYTESDAGGGFERESNSEAVTRYHEARKGHHEATWSGILANAKTVRLASGHRVQVASLFEDFENDTQTLIIDDGTGLFTSVSPIDNTTIPFGGADYVYKDADGYSIYWQIPSEYLPIVQWNDGVDAVIWKYSGGAWALLAEGVDYWINIYTGMVGLAVPIQSSAGERLRAQFNFYVGLTREVAKYVNGIRGSDNVKGWRACGRAVRVLGPSSRQAVNVAATLHFVSGYDSQFGRELGAIAVMSYLNAVEVEKLARYGIIDSILHDLPGIEYVSELLLNSGTTDVNPTTRYGVVRAGTVTL